ncbi:acyl-CoA thioesterase [Lutibacter sp. HS1-25]|uniref:acyl-CoA thioesterase n=1 Tax=Lutibacter sp. HS1-25 TaxID=2485000 RepID=UPI00101387B1|nr:thioesterase family protein [Lutibacter sp. HS1-25]RXP55792.1 acyl-CoA thioesterase [Lutibacter sp. HS1-25]
MSTIFNFSFEVSANELDHLNHVNNVVYLHWVLDAAQKHWDFLSNDIINEAYVWVVLRHEIDYVSFAKLGDKIQINTWVKSSVGVKSERIVEIQKEGKLIAKAKTIWCLLDKKTMKPVRIPSEIMKLFA